MARNLINDMYYTTEGGVVPVKWTAPEVGGADDVIMPRQLIVTLPQGPFVQEVFLVQ